jgi:predicted TIM-barrel fold metal-dependent hydrolase
MLHEAAPERCVWGSDWPHVSHWGTMMNVGDLLDLLADWVPDDEERRRILVDNPARLYGFVVPGRAA